MLTLLMLLPATAGAQTTINNLPLGNSLIGGELLPMWQINGAAPCSTSGQCTYQTTPLAIANYYSTLPIVEVGKTISGASNTITAIPPATGLASGNLSAGVLSSTGNPLVDLSSAQQILNKDVSSSTNLISLGAAVNQFNGLQFALAQGGIGTPTGTMSGYVAGDNVTLFCTGITFTTAPTIGITAVTAGAATGANVINPGITSGVIPYGGGAANCSQASTSGVGTGLNITAKLGVIAAYVQVPSLSTGGTATNGNFFLNVGLADGSSPSAAGPENTFIGDKAGFAFTGNSSLNLAVGHNACGNGGSGAVSSNNVCVGDDAGRNAQGTFSAGANVLVGSGAGRNVANGFNVAVGNNALGGDESNPGAQSGANNIAIGPDSLGNIGTDAASVAIGRSSLVGQTSSTGNENIAIGYYAMSSTSRTTATENLAIGDRTLQSCTTCANNIGIGWHVMENTQATGSGNIFIGNAIDSVAGGTSNEINIGGLLFYTNASVAAPAVTGCGTSSIDAHANNRSGTVTAGTGTACTVTFAGSGYGSWNHCRVTPHSVIAGFSYSYTLTVLTINATATSGDVFDYDCDGV